ncbi:hypothetical protein [Pseudoalteromonas sp. PB2-1]|uniref:hypothetical protein n=1 Tax=Pseudoalteromonas sp. PB2-1 TaxID=2907242 RepID=UPI0038669A72
MKWTNDSKERLYEIARSYDPQLLTLEEAIEENPVIVKLAQRFGDEPKAVLFMLAKMVFFQINIIANFKTRLGFTRAVGVMFYTFSIQALFEKLPTNLVEELEAELVVSKRILLNG